METPLTICDRLYAQRRKRTKRRRRIGRTLVCVGVLLLGFCVGAIVTYQTMASKATDLYPAPFSVVDKQALEPTIFHESGPFPDVDWDYWSSINPDLIGWITVFDTPINYPIVKAKSDDPDYYLKHDIYGDYNIFGCPYVDAGCLDLFESPNTVIYGHHMANGSMFSAFASFIDRSFADDHRLIYVQTPTERRIYEAQAADTIDGSEAVKRISFTDHDDFLAYYADRLRKSDLQRYDDLEASSCITFCTCSYRFNPANERTLVYAKPIQINGVSLGDNAV